MIIQLKIQLLSWQEADNLLRAALDEKYHMAIPEISLYLLEGVGNSTRIDYGTGLQLQYLIASTYCFNLFYTFTSGFRTAN